MKAGPRPGNRIFTCPQCGRTAESEFLPIGWLILRKSVTAGKANILQAVGSFDSYECLENSLIDRRDELRRLELAA